MLVNALRYTRFNDGGRDIAIANVIRANDALTGAAYSAPPPSPSFLVHYYHSYEEHEKRKHDETPAWSWRT